MKTSNIVAAAALALQSQHVQANPISKALMARGKSSIALSILELIGGFIPTEDAFMAWETKDHPNFCSVYMETKDGGHCKGGVECQGGYNHELKEDDKGWKNCRVGGENKFSDEKIGDFSITFKERDGKNQGEGLTTPILKLKYVGNWKEIPVQTLAEEYNPDETDKDDGPYLCHNKHYDAIGLHTDISSTRRKSWTCGVPQIGKGGGGLDSNGPTNDRGYRGGTCNVHVVQYQKPDPSKDKYQIEISSITDENENKIGGVGKSGPDVTLKSKLPYTLRVWTLNVDDDPVKFHYDNQKWTSDDDNCSTGKYDSGNRDMDCTFKC
ncbi:hypothetical protein IQ06DRAFT_320233 [Phaeosphaeriaceae sp. SRC1lsM3a]|nr:hypothetical protein IQ06DRAFT_320233 [Stagonospora sp. SRC1lsM3a]